MIGIIVYPSIYRISHILGGWPWDFSHQQTKWSCGCLILNGVNSWIYEDPGLVGDGCNGTKNYQKWEDVMGHSIYILYIFVLFSDKMNGTIWNPICIWMFVIVYGFTSRNISYNLVLEAFYCFMLRTFSVGPCNKKRFQQQCVETHLLQRVLSRIPAKDSKGDQAKLIQ